MKISLFSLSAVIALTIALSPSPSAAIPTTINRRPHHANPNPNPNAIADASNPRSLAVVTSFKNHRVVRININTEADLKALTDNEQDLGFDYFTHNKGIGGTVDVRVPAQSFKTFQGLKLNYTTVVEDLQAVIDEEQKTNEVYEEQVWGQTVNQIKNAHNVQGREGGESQIFASPLAASAWFKGYHSYADHVKWLNAQIAGSKGKAKGFSAGKSFEGRPQAGIRFGTGGKHIVFHGTQHAREWVTTMTVEYMITQLLNSKNKKVAGYLKKYTFHIIPIMNPDGFVVSQTTNRMHRKNAQPNGRCLGTDINRNWDSHFGEGGSSTNPCADDYMGPRPFSTPEASNMARYLRSLPNVAAYLDIHSFSQLWMVPFGYTSTRPGTYAYMDGLAAKAVTALEKVHGTRFRHGDIFHTIYQSSGTSVDYVYEVVKAKVAMAVELRDTGRNGFMLPPEQILPTGEETWAAMGAILDNIK
ncbi:MAG: putative carboxypeptidase [Linnemannia gamsii]|nr:MAG: putative carboxypeptidase [Linnemannia gamsii]